MGGTTGTFRFSLVRWPHYRMWTLVFACMWVGLGLLFYSSPTVVGRDEWLAYSAGFVVFTVGMTVIEQYRFPLGSSDSPDEEVQH